MLKMAIAVGVIPYALLALQCILSPAYLRNLLPTDYALAGQILFALIAWELIGCVVLYRCRSLLSKLAAVFVFVMPLVSYVLVGPAFLLLYRSGQQFQLVMDPHSFWTLICPAVLFLGVLMRLFWKRR